MTELAAHELLDRIFSVVVEEAKANPKFAKKILQNLPQNGVVTKVHKKKVPNVSKPEFDATDYHAVNILRTFGEGVLKGRLSELTKDKLRKIAAYSGLVLTGAAAKKSASKSVIIQGIVDAAKQYVAQRGIAAA